MDAPYDRLFDDAPCGPIPPRTCPADCGHRECKKHPTPIALVAQPEAGRLPDHTDEEGFPWWDHPAGTCPICQADTWFGTCTYNMEH